MKADEHKDGDLCRITSTYKHLNIKPNVMIFKTPDDQINDSEPIWNFVVVGDDNESEAPSEKSVESSDDEDIFNSEVVVKNIEEKDSSPKADKVNITNETDHKVREHSNSNAKFRPNNKRPRYRNRKNPNNSTNSNKYYNRHQNKEDNSYPCRSFKSTDYSTPHPNKTSDIDPWLNPLIPNYQFPQFPFQNNIVEPIRLPPLKTHSDSKGLLGDAPYPIIRPIFPPNKPNDSYVILQQESNYPSARIPSNFPPSNQNEGYSIHQQESNYSPIVPPNFHPSNHSDGYSIHQQESNYSSTPQNFPPGTPSDGFIQKQRVPYNHPMASFSSDAYVHDQPKKYGNQSHRYILLSYMVLTINLYTLFLV